MPSDSISFRETNYFSSLICDYLDEKLELQAFYNRFPTLDNFKLQIEEKTQSFRMQSRIALVEVLNKQYEGVKASQKTKDNISSLSLDKTFTITTGHQLNLFTGPLYFLYKIISTVNLTAKLKAKYPDCNFVPVFWMATEDHDFEEINYFNFKGKKIVWSHETSGAVGRLKTEGLDKVFQAFEKHLGQSEYAQDLKKLFKNAYLDHDDLVSATRYLANELFGSYGLVIIDGDDKNLKQVFIPFVKRELQDNISFNKVSSTNEQLKELNYRIQVNPREINLFYLENGLRERIVFREGSYAVLNSDIVWSKEEIISELNDHPERFSPNALLRPLFQEVVLPNLCYIGGGGELAYWLQLKTYFEDVKVTFPILLLRNSVLIKTDKDQKKISKLNTSINDLFLKQNELVDQYIKKHSKIRIDFTPQKEHLKKQFEDLFKLAEQTDRSFLGAVGAQEKKQIKGLEQLEKRLLKAQKRRLSDEVDRLKDLQDSLFPGQGLQERNLNFSELYIEFGDRLIQELVVNLQPLKGEFLVLNL